VRRSVSQAGLEERGAHAGIAEGRIHEEVVHHQDAIGNQRIEAGVEAGESLKPPARLGHELHSKPRIPLEEIEQDLHFRTGRKRSLVKGEVAFDQLDQLGAIFAFSRTDHHRASLASVQ